MMSTLIDLFAGRFTQATRLLRLTTPLGADLLLAECVRGEETISAGFSFTISALSTDAGISLRALLGQPALLEVLTAASGQARPFHGYLSAVELNGANGGMARYTLTLQPWTVFLARSRDSRVFQDMTVCEILDAVFAPYVGLGMLAPSWRYDLADQSIYPKRSLTTQYQESDLAFAERLMSEEGLYYFFTHTGDAASPSLGAHELVIADHNGAFVPNTQPVVRFTQPGAVMKEDSMDRWRSELKLQTNGVELRSWDYRTLDSRPVGAAGVQADGAALVSSDAPGPYAYQTRGQGQRIADQQMQALEARREVFIGAGTVRSMTPGTTFTLADHAVFDPSAGADSNRFAVVRVLHLMHNNLSAELQGELHQRLGLGALAELLAADEAGSLHAVGSAKGERPLYRNRIDAIRASLPFRASRSNSHGELLHPRPTIRGQQSAIVVGPAGSVIHTDRDHRVKVQFHWQRGELGHSRLAHPAPDGQTGAPGGDSAGTWVRVATPLAPVAGANWGGHALPRVGQEVLVDFLEGNIDRPVIIGTLYNGAGQIDAQHNQIGQGAGVATGNAPAWFPGEAGAHAHPDALSGLKSQAMRTSQAGSGAYSQLVFDDSPEQARLSLQRHASAHQGTDELNLGHLRHQSDNQRLAPAGFGAELKTEHSAALRAAKGMLLSTNSGAGPQSDMLESADAHAQVTQSQELQLALTETAHKHNAKLEGEGAPDKLPAIAATVKTLEVLDSTELGEDGDDAGYGKGGGAGEVSAYSDSHLQLASPYGIAATTARSAVLSSGETSSITAGQDINFAVQGNVFKSINLGISMFTYGKAAAGDKPNQETGIRLHAASGKFSMQSQAGQTRISAQNDLTLASVAKTVTIAGKEHVLMTAMGAFMKVVGGNIMLHGPGIVEFKAGMKILAGPQSSSPDLPNFPNSEYAFGQAFQLLDDKGEPMKDQDYTIYTSDDQEIRGKTDSSGKTAQIDTKDPESTYIIFDRDLRWEVEDEHDEDDDVHHC